MQITLEDRQVPLLFSLPLLSPIFIIRDQILTVKGTRVQDTRTHILSS